jgi:dihydrodipicolinate synthase/N-acetylneuraminate lyase
VLKASRDELTRRFAALAHAVDTPIVAYNSPRRSSGIELTLDDLDAIMNVAPIVGSRKRAATSSITRGSSSASATGSRSWSVPAIS